jgi:hypothetical protein
MDNWWSLLADGTRSQESLYYIKLFASRILNSGNLFEETEDFLQFAVM